MDWNANNATTIPRTRNHVYMDQQYQDEGYHRKPNESFSSASFQNNNNNANEDDGFGIITKTSYLPPDVPGIGSYQSFGLYNSGGIFGGSDHLGDRSTGDPIFDSRSSVVSGGDDGNIASKHSFASSDQYSKHFVSAKNMSPNKLSQPAAGPTNRSYSKHGPVDDSDDDLIIPIPPPPKVVRNSSPMNHHVKKNPPSIRSFDTEPRQKQQPYVDVPTFPLSPNDRNVKINPSQRDGPPKQRPHTTTNATSVTSKATNDFRVETFHPTVSSAVAPTTKLSQKKTPTNHKPAVTTVKQVKSGTKSRPKTPPFLRLGRSKTPEQQRRGALKSKSPTRSALPVQEPANHRFSILQRASFQNEPSKKPSRSKSASRNNSSRSIASNSSTSIPEVKSKTLLDRYASQVTQQKPHPIMTPHGSSTAATVVTADMKKKQPLARPNRTKTPEKPRSKTPERLRNVIKLRSNPVTGSTIKSRVPEIVIQDSASIVSNMTKTTQIVPSSEKNTTKKGFFRKLFGGRGGKGKIDHSTSTVNESEKPMGSLSNETISEKLEIVSIVQEPSSLSENGYSRDNETSSGMDDQIVQTKGVEAQPVTSTNSGVEKVAKATDSDNNQQDMNTSNVVTAKPSIMHIDHSHIPTVQEDRPEMFYSNDDISTLTVPTIEAPSSFGMVQNATSFGSSTIRSHRPRRRGDDPSVRSSHSSDPMGKYWQNQPITKIIESPNEKSTPTHENASNMMANVNFPTSADPFVDPDGASPSVTPALKIEPQATFDTQADPVGNSPLPSTRNRRRPKVVTDQNDSPQLFPSSRTIHDPSPQGIHSFAAFASESDVVPTPSMRDPIGESPVHQNGRGPSALRGGSPVAPDPPLYLKVLHADDSDLYVTDDVDDEDAIDGNDGSFPFPTKTTIVDEENKLTNADAPAKTMASAPVSTTAEASTRRTSIKQTKAMTALRIPRSRPLFVKVEESKTISSPSPVTDETPRSKNLLRPSSSQSKPTTDPDSANVPLISPRVGILMQKIMAKSPRHTTKPSPKNSHLSISPSLSDSSSFFSETMATRKAKQRLTMSKAARVNAKAVALLHTMHGQPSPRNCWQDADTESVATSTTAINEFLHGGAINDVLQSNKANTTAQMSSILYSSLRKGKFKYRKVDTGSKAGTINRNESSEQESVEMTKVETAVSQLQSKLNVHLGISPARSRATPKATKSKHLYTDNHDPSLAWGSPFPKVDETNVAKKGDFLVDINECFPEFTPTNQESSGKGFQFPELLNTSISSSQYVFSGQRNTVISKFAVQKGYDILRSQREYDISTGKSLRVLPTPAVRLPKVTTKSQEYEPLDPIQRAGRRLLSKAAVPIQAAARRYLAQLEAVDRMWALIEIQSYARRWRAETALVSSRHSAITIQAVVRGFLCTKRRLLMVQSVVMIQKMVRGYIAAAKTYDLIYCIVLVQAQVRGWVARFRIRRHLAQVKAAAQLEAACMLQTWWRSQSSRMLYEFLRYDTVVAQCAVRRYLARRRTSALRHQRQIMCATKIQSAWRGIQAYSAFIFYLVDIMLIQRSVRCWIAKREVEQRRITRSALRIQSTWRGFVVFHSYTQFKAVLLLQTVFRGFAVRIKNKRHQAATTIQKEWRCFSTYTDYILTIADIICIQNATRRWLTKREVTARNVNLAAVKVQTLWRSHQALSRYKKTTRCILQIQCVARSLIAKNIWNEAKIERSATTIQKHFRRHSARQLLLHDFVQVILIQSLARRFVSRRLVKRKLAQKATTQSHDAATLIQSAWRGFWEYSHYVILQYEVVRIQSMIRGKLFRNDFNLQLGCSIMIQAAVRRFLAMKKVHRLKVTEVWTGGQVQGIIDVQATRRIQFWWRVVLDCRREKRAALVIERFFLMIKHEIETEIQRREKSKQDKRKRRHREKREDDDKLLERAWLNTVDSATDVFSFASDNASDVFDFSPKHKSKSHLSSSAHSPIKKPSSATKKGDVLPSPVEVVKKPVGKADKIFGDASGKKTSSSMTSSKRSDHHSKGFSVSHRASSPPKHLIMRHEYDESPNAGVKAKRPASARSSRTSSRDNERSASSPLRRAKALTRKKSIDLVENLSLEEAYLDASIKQEKERRKHAKTAPHKESLNSRFFADDLESIDDGCNFLDEFTEAAEALTDMGRARTKQITSDLTTAINQTRLTIKGATESIANRSSSSTSFLLFGNDASRLTINEKPDVVLVDPLKVSTSKTPKSSRNSNATTPKSFSRSSNDHGEFASPRKSMSETTPKTAGHEAMPYASPRKSHTGTTPTSTRHSKELHSITGGDGAMSQPTIHSNAAATAKSPRHGKLLVMHPLKEYPKRLISVNDENDHEYDAGGEFGMI